MESAVRSGAWILFCIVSHSAHNPSSFFIESGRAPGPTSAARAEPSGRSVPVDTNTMSTTRHEGRSHAITPLTGGETNRENRD